MVLMLPLSTSAKKMPRLGLFYDLCNFGPYLSDIDGQTITGASAPFLRPKKTHGLTNGSKLATAYVSTSIL
jgi:hypothetical protein